eukprot:TRINITY_DN100767_c0_g1_i1.p1 TRINITY_DN100767_c0_g1~~TRINITY_DN100767_c0_g1_i1.p1  ORF type:complete len:651 (+),score=164.41 TRINITY_DN100767_c0_g1_i1:67-2019(+)
MAPFLLHMNNLLSDICAEFLQEIVLLTLVVTGSVAYRRLYAPAAKGKSLQRKGPPSTSSLPGGGSTNERSSAPAVVKLAKSASPAAAGKLPDWVTDGEARVRQLLQQKEFMRALNLFRSLERWEPKENKDEQCPRRCFSEEIFHALLQASIRVGHLDVVERLLLSMHERCKTTPSADFWQGTLKMLSARKHYELCLEIYATFADDLPRSTVVFSCLINAALELSRPAQAAKMIPAYLEAPLEPADSVVIFRTFQATGDLDSAIDTFRRLGKRTASMAFNIMLLTCVNGGKAEQALQLLEEGLQLDSEVQQGHRAQTSPAGRMVSVVSYNTVIRGFAQKGLRNECCECVAHMVRHGVEPDDITFGSLLAACLADEAVETAKKIIHSLTSNGRQLDGSTCAVFVKGLVRAKSVDKAFTFYQEVQQNQAVLQLDIITYSILIKALVDQFEVEKALSLVADMKRAGHKVDDIILTHLLEGFRHLGKVESGVELFEETVKAGVVPSEYTLMALMKLLSHCGEHEQALQILGCWAKKYSKKKPSVLAFTCVLASCIRSRKPELGWQTYELMTEQGVAPDAMAVSTLLRGLVAAQLWPKVLQLCRNALLGSPSVEVTAQTLNNALAQMRASGDDAAASELEAIMEKAKVDVKTRRGK